MSVYKAFDQDMIDYNTCQLVSIVNWCQCQYQIATRINYRQRKVLFQRFALDCRISAQNILDIGKRVKNPTDFDDQMRDELGEFGFPNNLIFDFWGVITDAKAGILTSPSDSVSTGVTRLSKYSALNLENVYEDRL